MFLRFDTRRLFHLLLGVYFLVGAHYTFPNFGGYGLNLPQNFVAWIFAGPLIGLGLWQWVRHRTFHYSVNLAIYWIGAGILTIPLFFSNVIDFSSAAPRVMGLIGGLLLYTAVLQMQWTSSQWRLVLILILACVAVESVLGLIQYFVLEPGNYLGYDALGNRPQGSFQQVNVMASFIATGFAISLFLTVSTGAPTRGQTAKLGAVLAGFVALSAPFLLVVIQSRTGQLGALAALLLLLPSLRGKAPIFGKQLILWSFLAGSGLITGLGALNTVESAKRPPTIYEDPGARAIIYGQSFEVIQQSPLIGGGYGNFENAWRQKHAQTASPPGNVVMGLHALSHPHNETLLWLVEGGLLAFSALLILALGLLRSLWRVPWTRGLGLLALVAPILIHTQTEYPLYHSSLHWIILIVLLASIDASCLPIRSVRFPRVVLPATLALLVPATVVPFMVTGLQSLAVITQLESKRPRDFQLLMKISNPIPDHHRFQQHLWDLRLRTALANNDEDELAAYIAWSKILTATQPRAPLFRKQVLVLRALGRVDEAEDVLAEARYLLGDRPEFSQLGTPNSEAPINDQDPSLEERPAPS